MAALSQGAGLDLDQALSLPSELPSRAAPCLRAPQPGWSRKGAEDGGWSDWVPKGSGQYRGLLGPGQLGV